MSSSVMKPCVDINLSDEDLKCLVQKAKDWMIIHGASMRSKEKFNNDRVQISPFLLLPSSYPREQFQLAKEVQTIVNELMHKVAHDHEFLINALKSTIEVDDFTAKLFDIYRTVHAEGFTQDMSLGLIRSDYMLHGDKGNKIKQVEVNMIASSFGGLAVVVTDYQKFILTELGHRNKLENIPENNVSVGLSSGLVEAWKAYNNKKAVILFIVEDITYNICDQRAIEFKVQELEPDIKIIRKDFTTLISEARLGPNKELLVNNKEVAVIYYRSGYQSEAYPSDKEWGVRLLLERSRAIKCPSIHYHLAGTKKVQQELAVPGVLEKFVADPHKVAKLRETFMGLYSLDLNEDGDRAVNMAIQDPKRFVLKPQREGGGNNFYDEEVKNQLENKKDSIERTAWILMERIYPPQQENYLIRAGDDNIKLQKSVSELGIYGIIMGNQNNVVFNKQVGHVLRTKPSSANEGGIVSGAGALDCPYLIN